ncbi:MAG: PIN domain-containing protein [Verrucomicrobiales bacterium]
MPSPYFLDTNVLIYAFDQEEPEKRRVSLKLIADSAPWQISWQVVQEFCSVALHNKHCQVPAHTFDPLVELLLAPHCTVYPDPALWQSALRVQSETGYRFYDSLIVASALRSGARILYSEDLQHGRCINDLEIRSPFR